MAIRGDTTHPLNYAFELLPSGRRYRTLKAIKAIYKQTFVRYAISILNKGSTMFLGGMDVLVIYLMCLCIV